MASQNPPILQPIAAAFADSPMASLTPVVPFIAEKLEMDDSMAPMNEKLTGTSDEAETSDHGTDDSEEADSEAGSSEDSSSGDDGEEEEPALKYEVVGGHVQEILAKDSASALDVSQRLMVGVTLSLQSPADQCCYIGPWDA